MHPQARGPAFSLSVSERKKKKKGNKRLDPRSFFHLASDGFGGVGLVKNVWPGE